MTLYVHHHFKTHVLINAPDLMRASDNAHLMRASDNAHLEFHTCFNVEEEGLHPTVRFVRPGGVL